MELELREEIDLGQAKIRELKRDKEAALEVVFDHENTIAKFRNFVSQVGAGAEIIIIASKKLLDWKLFLSLIVCIKESLKKHFVH